MNRLTRNILTETSPMYELGEWADNEEALDKLGQLEDIEEEIGIDLIKAVKLCKQVNRNKVVYTKEKWGIDTLKLLDELDIELFNHRLYGNERGIYVSLDLYNYGITWALTKEELEQNEWNINKSNKFNQCYKVIN